MTRTKRYRRSCESRPTFLQVNHARCDPRKMFHGGKEKDVISRFQAILSFSRAVASGRIVRTITAIISINLSILYHEIRNYTFVIS